MHLQALLSQAGFPGDTSPSAEHAVVSAAQWEEFLVQFRAMLSLLRQIAAVWNLEDPCVVSGFDMDRAGCVQALAHEPAGTFVCRFSMSQPGCLVLTCKTGHSHPNADSDGLVHAILKVRGRVRVRVRGQAAWRHGMPGASNIGQASLLPFVACTCNLLTRPMAMHACGCGPAVQIDDLYERRVDTWIRDYAGATHVLDVYRQKRVDKRKVFTSNYTRLRELPTMEHNAQALLMASMNSDTMGRLLDSR